MSQLIVQSESNTRQTTYNIHHFRPDMIRENKSSVHPIYDYVSISHGGDRAMPVCVRLYFERAELLELFDKLAPIVAAWRETAPCPQPTAAGSLETPEITLL